MSNYTIGIAGHIDHGKTTLTKAMTNVDTDRLKEEKERGISIELGFAPLNLPSEKQIGIIDVPGHERFIRQMIAGAAGVDLILLTIAADEGVMPQTKEHVDILKYLGIEKGIIVVTKSDIVDDEWLEFVIEEIKEWSETTFLKNSPIIAVSGKTKLGVDNLLNLIDESLDNLETRKNDGIFRMPIDRVFTKKGIGTIITGTVYEGTVSTGDVFEIIPYDQEVKVKQINVHHQKVNKAYAGQRVALNISNVNFKDISRGETIVTKGFYKPTDRIDIEFESLNEVEIKQRDQIRLHIGTSEVLGKIIFFDRNKLSSTDKIVAQLQLEEPITCKNGDRFILRRPTPQTTLGGGKVIAAYSVKRKFGENSVKELQALASGDSWDSIYAYFQDRQIASIDDISNFFALSFERVEELIKEAIENELLVKLNNNYILSETLTTIQSLVESELKGYHEKYPMRVGMKSSELRSKMFANFEDKQWKDLINYLSNRTFIVLNEDLTSLSSFIPTIPDNFKSNVNNLLKDLEKMKLTPNDWNELSDKHKINGEMKRFLQYDNKIVFISENLAISTITFNEAIKSINSKITKNQEFAVSDIKDVLEVSRKYLIPFLEYLDEKGYSKRIENKRIWLK